MPTQRPTLGLAPALPGIVLVIVIAWALAAVLILTGTLVNAREIKDDVDVINGQVSPIEKDLRYVALAGQTVDISGRINAAAQPLTGQATQILQAARRIDATARSILNTAGTINQTVHTINNTVRQIEGTVIVINGRVQAIGGLVGSIFSRVQTIGGRVASIHNLVGRQGATDRFSIAGNVQRILTTATNLDPVVQDINAGGSTGGVRGINERADRAIAGAASIKSDFDQILANVGFGFINGAPDHGTPSHAAIHGHANSINCAALLNQAVVGLPAIPPLIPAPVNLVGGPTDYCNR